MWTLKLCTTFDKTIKVFCRLIENIFHKYCVGAGINTVCSVLLEYNKNMVNNSRNGKRIQGRGC